MIGSPVGSPLPTPTPPEIRVPVLLFQMPAAFMMTSAALGQARRDGPA